MTSAGADNPFHIRNGFIEDVVYDDEIIPRGLLNFTLSGGKTPRYLFGRLGASALEPLPKRVYRRRKNEDSVRLRINATDLTRSLYVDIEQHIEAGFQPLFDLHSIRPVELSMNFRPLDKAPIRYSLLELLAQEKMIVLSGDLPGPRPPRGAGNGKAQLGPFRPHGLDHGGLADAGGSGNYKELALRMKRHWIILFSA
jgi:hypothetical protein